MKQSHEQEYAEREETGGSPHFDKFGFVIEQEQPTAKEDLAARLEALRVRAGDVSMRNGV